MRHLLIVLALTIFAGPVKAGEECYHVLQLIQVNDSVIFDIFNNDSYTKLQEHVKQEQLLVEKALREAFSEWSKIDRYGKTLFNVNGNQAGLRISLIGTFPSLDAAEKKLQECEDSQETADASTIDELSGLATAKKQALQAQAAFVAARELVHKKLLELESAGTFGPIPSGLHRATPAELAAIQRRRINAAARRGLQYLLANREGSSWSGGNGSPIVTTAVAGLALLGATPHGSPYSSILSQITKELATSIKIKNSEPVECMFTNWFLGFTGVFLSEYYAHYPSKEVADNLSDISRLIARTQASNGCWHHGYGPKAEYEVHAACIQCLATLALVHSYGLPMNEDALKKALDNMAPDNGHVGYSTDNGHETAGRTAGMAWALFCGGREGTLKFANERDFVCKNPDQVPTGHSSPALHFLWAALFSCTLGEKGWDDYWSKYGEKILSLQEPDGSFKQAPWADADMEKIAGPNYTTALYTLILVLPRGNLTGIFKRSQAQYKLAATRGRGAWLGLKLEQSEGGLLISDCAPTGPAWAMGLSNGMILVDINSKPVATTDSAAALIKQLKVGETLSLSVKKTKNGKSKSLQNLVVPPRPLDDKMSNGWY